MKLKLGEFEQTQRAVNRIREIDECIERLGNGAPDKIGKLGDDVRDALGRNHMRLLTNDQLGEVVLCAVINALLEDRCRIVEGDGKLVEFPDPPCPTQTPQEHAE